jgi:hypothetical protein
MKTDKQRELEDKRRALRPLLSPHDPADALASYYALWHDPQRTELTVHTNQQGRADGYVAICWTGADLFRPLVTLRTKESSLVGMMLEGALEPNRPYRIVAPVELASALRGNLRITRSTLNRIYRLDPSRFEPVINVLVQRVSGRDEPPRFQIESQGRLAALAGANWRSPSFAEIFVYVEPRGRGRGWGKSVVSACTAALLEDKVRPLYVVEEGNEVSIHIAEELGYVDTGLREFSAEGMLEVNAA